MDGCFWGQTGKTHFRTDTQSYQIWKNYPHLLDIYSGLLDQQISGISGVLRNWNHTTFHLEMSVEFEQKKASELWEYVVTLQY